MRVRFALNLLFVLLLNLLVKPLWIFGVDREVQNLCGPSYYGTFFAIYNFSFLFHILLDFGLNHLNNTQASRDNSFIKENLSSILVLKSLLSLVYFILTLTLAWASGFSEQQLSWLVWLGINLILLNFILFFRSSIASAQKFILDGVLSVLDRLLSVVFCFYLIYFQHNGDSFDLNKFVHAQSLALLISAIVSGIAVLSLKIRLHWVFDLGRIKDIVKRSIPFAIQGLLMIMYYRLDGVLLERLPIKKGAYHAGIYAASYRLYEAATMVPYLFSTLLLPMFARMLSSGEDVKPLLRVSGRLIFMIASATCMVGLFDSVPIMEFLYPNADNEWAIVFSIMMITYLPVSFVYIHGTLLLAAMDLKTMNKIVGIGLLINIVLNLVLIPWFQSGGAAVAALVTNLFVSASYIYRALKLAGKKSEGKEWATFMIHAILLLSLGGIGYLFKLHFIVSIFMISVGSVIGSLFTGLMKKEDWKNLFYLRTGLKSKTSGS